MLGYGWHTTSLFLIYNSSKTETMTGEIYHKRKNTMTKNTRNGFFYNKKL